MAAACGLRRWCRFVGALQPGSPRTMAARQAESSFMQREQDAAAGEQEAAEGEPKGWDKLRGRARVVVKRDQELFLSFKASAQVPNTSALNAAAFRGTVNGILVRVLAKCKEGVEWCLGWKSAERVLSGVCADREGVEWHSGRHGGC